MAAKVEAIAHHFPDGQAVVIERPPHNILPSTGLLVETQMAVATDVPMSDKETQATYRILEDFRHNLGTMAPSGRSKINLLRLGA